MSNISLDSFIETGLWSTIDYDTDEHLDAKYSIHDCETEFLQSCQEFIDSFMELATPYFTEHELNHSPIAHDLWLTVEGHGAGFWDGDYQQGEKLTEIVKQLQPYDSFWSEKLNENIKREEVENEN